MLPPSFPSSVIDQSHPQKVIARDTVLLDTHLVHSQEEEEEEEGEEEDREEGEEEEEENGGEENAAHLYSTLTLGNKKTQEYLKGS